MVSHQLLVTQQELSVDTQNPSILFTPLVVGMRRKLAIIPLYDALYAWCREGVAAQDEIYDWKSASMTIESLARGAA